MIKRHERYELWNESNITDLKKIDGIPHCIELIEHISDYMDDIAPNLVYFHYPIEKVVIINMDDFKYRVDIFFETDYPGISLGSKYTIIYNGNSFSCFGTSCKNYSCAVEDIYKFHIKKLKKTAKMVSDAFERFRGK